MTFSVNPHVTVWPTWTVGDRFAPFPRPAGVLPAPRYGDQIPEQRRRLRFCGCCVRGLDLWRSEVPSAEIRSGDHAYRQIGVESRHSVNLADEALGQCVNHGAEEDDSCSNTLCNQRYLLQLYSDSPGGFATAALTQIFAFHEHKFTIA